MASLGMMKVHEQNGTFRATMPREWVRENGIQNKTALDIIVSQALIVLPPKELRNEDVEEIVRDLRTIIKARTILQVSKIQENGQSMSKTGSKQ